MIVVYIAHPVSGDVDGNIDKIVGIVRDINLHSPGVIPFAPYITDLLALDDSNEDQRRIGMENNAEYFKRKAFDKLWLFSGEDGKISSGMWSEAELAAENNIPTFTVRIKKKGGGIVIEEEHFTIFKIDNSELSDDE